MNNHHIVDKFRTGVLASARRAGDGVHDPEGDGFDILEKGEEGWTDRDILDITQICAYFNFRDRMADALGVEIDETTIERAREGAACAAEQARVQGRFLPEDPWGVRNMGGGS